MPALNPATLGNLGTGSQRALEVLRPGSKGPQVERLKKALAAGGFYRGPINDTLGPQGVEALVRAKTALKLGGAPDEAGEFTIKHLEAFAARPSGSVDPNDPTLRKLATSASGAFNPTSSTVCPATDTRPASIHSRAWRRLQ